MDPETEKQLAEYDAKRRRIELILIAGLVILLGALLVLEVSIFDFRGSFPAGFNLLFFLLLNANIILIFLLLFLVFRNLAKLIFERKAKVLGSKLRTRLILAFVTFALVPTVVFFYVAVMYISNSIDRWFSIQVKGSLSESLEVAQTYYKAYEDSAQFFAERLSTGISDRLDKQEMNLAFPNDVLEIFLKDRKTEYNIDAVDVYLKQGGNSFFTAGKPINKKHLESEEKALLANGWKGKSGSGTFEMPKGEMVWGMAPILVDKQTQGVIVVRYAIPKSLYDRMRRILTAYEDYTKLQILEGPLKTSYVIILAMISMFIFFGATWFGFLLSRGMVVPIQRLAEGTRQVAAGDLNVKINRTTGDEFGTLVDNFNTMTDRLRESRDALQQAANELSISNEELERRRAYMETVLGNITAGVISLDEKGRVSTINPSVGNILAFTHPRPIGKTLVEILDKNLARRIQDMIDALSKNKQRTLERQVETQVMGRSRVLLVSVAPLTDDEGRQMGVVLVVDDHTELIKAQRMAAWQEVARRIAHEIKNPLTPIQLAAQRLRKRYGSRIPDDDKVFMDSTSTIIKQVEDLKEMVDEFSNFARMVEPRPAFFDVNEIISEALVLFNEAHKNIRFSFDKADGAPPLYCDRVQLKRVIINLIDNGIASMDKKGRIHIANRYDLTTRNITVTVEDSGVGLPQGYKDRIFEPYFSTKKMGTGLGLAIVHQIVSDLGGQIRMEDNTPTGTRVIITLPYKDHSAQV